MILDVYDSVFPVPAPPLEGPQATRDRAIAIDKPNDVTFLKVNQTSLFNFSSLESMDYWACESDAPSIKELADRHGVKLLT